MPSAHNAKPAPGGAAVPGRPAFWICMTLARDDGSGRGRRLPSQERELRARVRAKRVQGGLGIACPRLRAGDPAIECGEAVALRGGLLERDQRIGVVTGVDELDLAVLAHADARLRGFDLAAPDALPHHDRIGHRRATAAGKRCTPAMPSSPRSALRSASLPTRSATE